ncbi:hypothetical protein [Tsukamurella tyrosinosolvens]|uniref:hypothetical protein n=1 Tax=Tsukamurella tyrosinosolvens TaxID=57704 RepID=UPI003F4A345E
MSALKNTLTAASALADAEYVADVANAAQAYGLGFKVVTKDAGPMYVLRGVKDELVIRTYDIREADQAMLHYSPPTRNWYVNDGRTTLRLQLCPTYADEPATVIVATGPNNRGPWTEVFELSTFGAGSLARQLIETLVDIAK